jgi:hypothetical protein
MDSLVFSLVPTNEASMLFKRVRQGEQKKVLPNCLIYFRKGILADIHANVQVISPDR